MKGKHLAVLLVLVIVLGGLWFLISSRSSWSESGGAGGKVVEFPLNDVTHISIKSPDGEVNLVEKSDVWTVRERADYPAKFEEVSSLLRKLWELKTVQEIPVGPSQLPRLELVEPGKGSKGGTLVQLIGENEKPITALLLGKKYLRKGDAGAEMGMDGIPAGRYVKPIEGSKVSLVSSSLDEADPKPAHWITTEFLAISNPKSISVTGATDEQKWAMVRDSTTAEWKLVNAKEGDDLDASKVGSLGSVLSSVSVADVLSPGAKLEGPVTNVAIETFDGFHYDLKIGQAQAAGEPVQFTVSATLPTERAPGKDEKPEDKKRLDDEFAAKSKQSQEKLAKEKKLEGRAYFVPMYAVESLLKNRGDLLAPKPTPTPAPAVPPAPSVVPAPVAPPVPAPAVSPATAPAPSPSALPTAVPTPPAPTTVTTPPLSAPPTPVEAISPPVAASPVATPTPVPEATVQPAPTVVVPSPTPVSTSPSVATPAETAASQPSPAATP